MYLNFGAPKEHDGSRHTDTSTATKTGQLRSVGHPEATRNQNSRSLFCVGVVSGMRPLLYSEQDARKKRVGWTRTGHHIAYHRNEHNLQCPLLARERIHYVLEWQMVGSVTQRLNC